MTEKINEMREAGPRKVLVVDYEEAIVNVLLRTLTRAGYEVFIAKDGGEALQLVEATFPDDGTKPFDLADVTVRVGKALEKRDLIVRDRDHRGNLENRVAEQADHIRDLFQQSLETLCNALDAKDMTTLHHSRRTSALASALAARLCPDDPGFARMVRVAAVLHDLGKIGIPDAVLNKVGKLDAAEVALIQTHPETSESILEPLFSDTVLLACIRHHHEQWNGKGYPDGLVGEEIPLGARIIGVADAFDAMISPRPYRPTVMTSKQAISTLQEVAGSQLDARVVEALVAMNDEGTLAALLKRSIPKKAATMPSFNAAPLRAAAVPLSAAPLSARVVLPSKAAAPNRTNPIGQSEEKTPWHSFMHLLMEPGNAPRSQVEENAPCH